MLGIVGMFKKDAVQEKSRDTIKTTRLVVKV